MKEMKSEFSLGWGELGAVTMETAELRKGNGGFAGRSVKLLFLI